MGLIDLFRSDSPQRRLNKFQESLDELERRVKAVEMEWDLAYDKLHVMLGRISKRAEKLHNEAEDNGKLAPLPADQTRVPTIGSALTPRQKELQQQILRRRAGG